MKKIYYLLLCALCYFAASVEYAACNVALWIYKHWKSTNGVMDYANDMHYSMIDHMDLLHELWIEIKK